MPAAAPATSTATLEAVEREHILRALQEANWVIGVRPARPLALA